MLYLRQVHYMKRSFEHASMQEHYKTVFLSAATFLL